MGFSYNVNLNGMEELIEILPFIAVYIGVFLFAYLIGMLFQLAQYIFYSIGLYSIAKRRGLNLPWLAWIPVGSDWILGSLADQYQYLTAGKIRNNRKVLLSLRLAMVAAGLVLCGMVIAFVIRASSTVSYADELVVPIIGMVLVLLAFVVMSVVVTVFWHIARYHLYQSCDPRNGVAYMVLGLLFPVLDAVFMFICRNKDDGMPAPKEEVQPEPVPVEAEEVIQSEETVELPEPAEEPENIPESEEEDTNE